MKGKGDGHCAVEVEEGALVGRLTAPLEEMDVPENLVYSQEQQEKNRALQR